MEETFQLKYNEFCADLEGTCPELKSEILLAKNIPKEKRIEEYKTHVFDKLKSTTSSKTHIVLPFVIIPDTIWTSFSSKTIEAIKGYTTILNLCVMYSTNDVSGMSQEDVDEMMREWRSRMENVDFTKMSSKFFELFGKSGGVLPPLPEKFLKGQMAKLAEELVKDFDPEEFGFSPAELEACEKDPVRAFEILIKASTNNPDLIQNALQKIGKLLKQKIQSGQIKPQELAKEAEELMKEFQNNPSFVEILETLKGAFNFEDMDIAKATGKEGSARLSIVKARLQKKLEAKKSALTKK